MLPVSGIPTRTTSLNAPISLVYKVMINALLWGSPNLEILLRSQKRTRCVLLWCRVLLYLTGGAQVTPSAIRRDFTAVLCRVPKRTSLKRTLQFLGLFLLLRL